MATFQAVPLPDGSGLRLIGELDLATVPILEEALQGMIHVNGSMRLDLSDLSFMDSSGIHAIVRYAGSGDYRGALLLDTPAPIVARALEMVGIDKVPNIRVRTAALDG